MVEESCVSDNAPWQSGAVLYKAHTHAEHFRSEHLVYLEFGGEHLAPTEHTDKSGMKGNFNAALAFAYIMLQVQ